MKTMARVYNEKGLFQLCKCWLNLGAWVLWLVLFTYVIGPLGVEFPFFKPLAQYIEQNEINANEYYYTDVDEFADSDSGIRAYLPCPAKD